MKRIWKRSRERLVHALLLTAAMLTLIGCASQTSGGAGSNGVCAVWLPVTWADADSDETIRGVKGNNAARSSYCGKD